MEHNKEDIIICGKQSHVHLDIILPEQSDYDVTDLIEKELNVKCEKEEGEIGIFLPYNIITSDFGIYGRRWHMRVIIDSSKIDDFYESLRAFCIKHQFSLNENGEPVFSKERKSITDS